MTETRDRNVRQARDSRLANDQRATALGERNPRPGPDFSSGSERGGSQAPPRRTVVIRGQVADRYGTGRLSSGPHRVSGPYGLRMRPERAALWAVLLGLALVVAALASAHM